MIKFKKNNDLNAILSKILIPHSDVYLSKQHIKSIQKTEQDIHLTLTLGGYLDTPTQNEWKRTITHTLLKSYKNQRIQIKLETRVQAHTTQQAAIPNHPQIKNVVAISSGKGGVGKSTTTVQLALALNAIGARVGIMDADIYGPSIPLMTQLTKKPTSINNKITPLCIEGIQTMSIGYLIDSTQPAIWRGPMATQAIKQLFFDTDWKGLDYLLIDLPPGTGDIHLTLAQSIPLTTAVVVYTPQKLARSDARKGLEMFKKLNVNILGLIENMSSFVCGHCQKPTRLFQVNTTPKLDAPVLAYVPFDPILNQDEPALKTLPSTHPLVECYLETAMKISQQISVYPVDQSFGMPKIQINPKAG